MVVLAFFFIFRDILLICIRPRTIKGSAEPGTVCHRTRSRLPLENVSLQELECMARKYDELLVSVLIASPFTAVLQTSSSQLSQEASKATDEDTKNYYTFLATLYDDQSWLNSSTHMR